jgi:hypothetical protein
MAWVTVPGSNGLWEYGNDPSAGDYYEDANGTVTNGIRTFTPTGGNTQYTYVKCRKVGDGNNTGPWSELSKNYYDAQ